MAAAAYYAWGRAGRPLEPCQPIRDYVNRLKVAFPRAAAAHIFGWGADESHYVANPPQDHTPYSATGWPLPSPKWWVFATDAMHRPDLGVDCNVLFPYWLAEAKAGRTPWVKYLIWQARIYDVRNGWAPQKSSGHFDHIHISCRTDQRYTSLGAWQLVPGVDEGEPPMAQQMMVKFSGAPAEAGGPEQVWLCDGMFRRKVPADQIAPGLLANDGTHQPNLLGLLTGQPAGAIFQSAWSNRESWGSEYPPAVGAVTGEVVVNSASVDDIARTTADELHNRLAG